MGYSAPLKKAPLVGAFFMSAICLLPTNAAWALCPLPGALPQVSVQRVVDGDTLRLVDGRRVRLIGLNAPELRPRRGSAEPFAEQARRRLEALVAASDGRLGLQLGARPTDRYGRHLAHLYGRDGQNLEAQLLAEGLGYFVAFAPASDLLDCQRQAEQQARAAGKGLWRHASGVTPSQLTHSGFALVQGQISRVQHNRGGQWLELEGTLSLRLDSQALSPAELAHWLRMAGRRVEVRGWVVERASRAPEYPRWQLTVSDGSMLRLLP